jgi:hypothetical protein
MSVFGWNQAGDKKVGQAGFRKVIAKEQIRSFVRIQRPLQLVSKLPLAEVKNRILAIILPCQ